MLVLLFTSVTLSLTSALVLDNPLPLLLLPPASAANNNNNNNNTPIPIPNAPHVSFICNGVAFGYGLDNDSCNQAIALVGISTTVLSFGMRSVGAYDIPLPQRFISTDGKCVVEPSLTPGAIEARACPEDIAVAAFVVGAGNTDTWSWGQFWEVGVALAGMCVREGKEGVQTELGDNGWLYMEVGGPQTGFEEEANGTVVVVA
ncbi:MAG: hypothetical protein ASARMPRED_004192 [Alectoria sarmentosa]|nr:MAG: hypothetical protein ASARMPRED_004192 [Alectoria sarmentosa]